MHDSPEGVSLSVHIQPRASRTEYVGLQGDALKFRVAAPPVEGAANEALCRFLASRLGVAFSHVIVKAGAGARRKRVVVKGVTGQQVRESLGLGKGATT
ncbi:MAG: DUF167 domain-containing protein [Nitrospira sp.]|nr:MAG: DUF167 domain-containing protein [Nitrospira sp.]